MRSKISCSIFPAMRFGGVQLKSPFRVAEGAGVQLPWESEMDGVDDGSAGGDHAAWAAVP
jgi:hypothetical protein